MNKEYRDLLIGEGFVTEEGFEVAAGELPESYIEELFFRL
jgi:hypothetical protein